MCGLLSLFFFSGKHSLSLAVSTINFTPNAKQFVSDLRGMHKLVRQLGALRFGRVIFFLLPFPPTTDSLCSQGTQLSFTPTTLQERYKNTTHRTTVDPWFPIPNAQMWKRGKAVFADSAELEAGSSETSVVQPYWTTVINDRLPADTTICLKDCHGTATIGTRKPDIVGYVRGEPQSIFYVALVGELKGRRPPSNKADFSDDEKGQLLSFLEDLLKLQTHRKEVTGFLSDGCFIQFFRLMIIVDDLVLEEGPVESLASMHLPHFFFFLLANKLTILLLVKGGLWLAGALYSDLSKLGLMSSITMNSKKVTITGLLGVGQSAIVYSGSVEGNACFFKSCLNDDLPGYNKGSCIVVKSFRSTHQDRLAEEHHSLDILKTLVPLVPEMRGISDDGTALLLSPVGLRFSSLPQHGDLVPCGDDFVQLLNILEQVHAERIVHRDVRLCNFFRHPNTKKVLMKPFCSSC